MARIRDLGINALPMTIRPLEIGPGAVIGEPVAHVTRNLQCGPSNCEFCQCNETLFNDTSAECVAPTDCHQPSRKEERPGYHASGFTLNAVAGLKQQLRTRRTEMNH